MSGRRQRTTSRRAIPIVALALLGLFGAAYLIGIGGASTSLAGLARWLKPPAASTTLTTILLSSDAVVLPTSTGQTSIAAIVRASDGKPVVGANVEFSSTLGTVVPAIATSDANGIVHTTFRSGSVPGQAIVTASASTVTQQIFLQINSLANTITNRTITLTVAQPSLSAGEQTQINVTLRDSTGKPIAGEAVTLFGSLGLLEPANAVTDNNGQIVATYTASNAAGQARLTALSGYTSSTIVVPLRGSPPHRSIFLPFVHR